MICYELYKARKWYIGLVAFNKSGFGRVNPGNINLKQNSEAGGTSDQFGLINLHYLKQTAANAK